MYLRCARATREIYLHTCNKHWHFATTHATPQVIGRSLQGPRSRSAQVDRVFLQQIERHDFEGRFMRRGESHPGCAAGLESFLPALGAQAPAVARLQPGEPGGRDRRRQIVAGSARKRQEFGIDPGADGMEADILGTGLAAAGPVEPGQRFCAAFGELLAENIAGFSHYLLLDHAGRRPRREANRASIASQIFGARSTPSSRAISWIPVGEVTLISVM